MGNLDGTSRDREAREQLAAAVCRGCVLYGCTYVCLLYMYMHTITNAPPSPPPHTYTYTSPPPKKNNAGEGVPGLAQGPAALRVGDPARDAGPERRGRQAGAVAVGVGIWLGYDVVSPVWGGRRDPGGGRGLAFVDQGGGIAFFSPSHIHDNTTTRHYRACWWRCCARSWSPRASSSTSPRRTPWWCSD